MGVMEIFNRINGRESNSNSMLGRSVHLEYNPQPSTCR